MLEVDSLDGKLFTLSDPIIRSEPTLVLVSRASWLSRVIYLLKYSQLCGSRKPDNTKVPGKLTNPCL